MAFDYNNLFDTSNNKLYVPPFKTNNADKVLEVTRGLINRPDSDKRLWLQSTSVPGEYTFNTGIKDLTGIINDKTHFTLDDIDLFKFLNDVLIEYNDDPENPTVFDTNADYTALWNKALKDITTEYSEYLKNRGINPHRFSDYQLNQEALAWYKNGKRSPQYFTQGDSDYMYDLKKKYEKIGENMAEVSNNNFLRSTPYLSPSLARENPELAFNTVRANARSAATPFAMAGTAAIPAVPWASAINTGGKFLSKYVIGPYLAGEAVNETLRLFTGTTLSNLISNYLLNNQGWNPFAAQFAGDMTNPGYWINFGGGTYTKPLLQRLGIAEISTRINPSSAIMNSVYSTFPKSKFLTNYVLPFTLFIDRNLYKFLRMTSPWLIGKETRTILSSDLPKFNFVKDASELESADPKDVSYLLFKSNKNNEKVFGNAMSLKRPDVNTTFHTQDYLNTMSTVDRALFSPLLAGAAATDIAVSDDRNPYIRGLEYGLLGRFGLQRMIDRRLRSNVKLFEDYINGFNNEIEKLHYYFNNRPKFNMPEGYEFSYVHDSLPIEAVKKGTHDRTVKPGFNYKKATFDDLIKFLNNATGELRGFRIDNNYLYNNSDGTIIAKRNPEGKIDLVNESALKEVISQDIDIFDYSTGNRVTGKISVGNDGTVTMPEEYINALKSNIDYVQNVLFPNSGIKVYGSSAGVTEAGFPHATHDVDFYITRNELDKLIKKGLLSEQDKTNLGTYTYKLKPELFGDKGRIDLNVIELTPEGMATGIRAEELYKLYFPEEYFLSLRDFKARLNNGDPDQTFHINRTPEELLEPVNPSTKTIMDSFDIDFLLPQKGKHKLRSWLHLIYSDPILVSQGLNQYAKSMLGSRVQLFPMSAEQLKDKELNLLALKKLGINLGDIELNRIASDPLRMKNVLDAWYMMDNTAMRYILGTWPNTTGYSSENFIKSATTWDPFDNKGNAFGAGLNATTGGDSLHIEKYSPLYEEVLKAFISPKTEYKSTNLLDLIDEINNNFGRNPKAPTLLRTASKGTQWELFLNLQRIYNERGWNFLLSGNTYGAGDYVSATRPFDITSDFIGFSPVKTRLHPMVSRLSSLPRKINPLDNYLFTTVRPIYPKGVDYYYAKTSPTYPIFRANQGFKNIASYPRGMVNYKDIPAGNVASMLTLIPPLFYTPFALGYSEHNDWVLNIVNQPDEVIQRMPEQDRRLFTNEGVDSLYNKYKKEPYHYKNQSDLDHAVYIHLKSIYKKYSDLNNGRTLENNK